MSKYEIKQITKSLSVSQRDWLSECMIEWVSECVGECELACGKLK